MVWLFKDKYEFSLNQIFYKQQTKDSTVGSMFALQVADPGLILSNPYGLLRLPGVIQVQSLK